MATGGAGALTVAYATMAEAVHKTQVLMGGARDAADVPCATLTMTTVAISTSSDAYLGSHCPRSGSAGPDPAAKPSAPKKPRK